MSVDGGAVLAGLAPPVGDGPLVEAEGGNDGRQGAAVSERGDDAQEQGLVVAEAIEGCALGGGEGLAAGQAAEAALLAGVGLDVALVCDAPARAGGVGAEYALGVHGPAPTTAIGLALVRVRRGHPFRLPPPPPFTVHWGATGSVSDRRKAPPEPSAPL